MEQTIVYAGLDYHQKGVQICVLNAQGQVLLNRPVANDWTAIVRAVERGHQGGAVRASIEACSGAANLAEELVMRAGWHVDLAHAGYVARMKGSPDKSDLSDAQLLADLERVGYVPRVWMAPEYIVELRRLVRHRRTLVDERRKAKQRIRALLRDGRIAGAPRGPWSLEWCFWVRNVAPLSAQSRWVIEECFEQLAWVGERIARSEERLREVTREDPLVAALLGEPGIGHVTAWVLRAGVGRFDRFRSARQLARFCGASPRNTASGQRQTTAGLVEACDRYLRATLMEAGHRLRRYDAASAALAARLGAAGKAPNVITAAVVNRWLRRLWHKMRPLGLAC